MKKLKIRKETLRELNPDKLAEIHGGYQGDSDHSDVCCDPGDQTITCQPVSG